MIKGLGVLHRFSWRLAEERPLPFFLFPFLVGKYGSCVGNVERAPVVVGDAVFASRSPKNASARLGNAAKWTYNFVDFSFHIRIWSLIRITML